MSEAEIIYQISELSDRIWNFSQWWVSISFGMLVASHFSAKKLNATLITIVLFLYVSFSCWLSMLLYTNIDMQSALVLDLASISSSGITSNVTKSVLLNFGPNIIKAVLTIITFLGTFVGCIFYLIYCYRQENRS